MKKFLILNLTVLAILVMLCTPVGAETKTIYVTAEDGLNIRVTPSTKREQIDTAPYGTELSYVCDTNDEEWCCISYDGRLRYVHTDYISDEQPEPLPEPIPEPVVTESYASTDLMYAGVINWGGWRWTWYSQQVLPGGGLSIPGRHVDASGYVCDGDGYICLASGSHSKGTVLDTPMGRAGKVYDYCATGGTIDIYTNW